MDIIKKTWYFRTVRARITFSFAVLLLMVHLLALLIMDTVLSYSNEVLPLNVDSSLGGESLNKSFQEFLKSLSHWHNLVLIFGSISFTCALFVSAWIAKGVAQPIRVLVDYAKSIQYGDYSKQLTLNRGDEMGQLGDVLQTMSDSIAKRESKLNELVNYDALTGLPNRNLFQDRLDQAIKVAKRGGYPMAVMIMDLNRFKEVNDILGHSYGDLLLKEVAKRLQTIVLREYDTVARLGGDEFVLLLATNMEGAKIVANKLLSVIDQSIELQGQEVIVTASIGISCFPEHTAKPKELLQYAELAMYSAKNSHTGFALFDSVHNAQDQQYLSLLAELRRAVLNNELVLYYQPKLELSTGKISHAEALVRWIHPERGLVPPMEFIPFAENTGFIRTITLWVIERSLRQQKELQAAGVALIVSINISAQDLFIPKFPTLFAELLEKYDIAAEYLVLEITESAIMSDLQSALGILNEIYDMGLRLSIDDFGTGYSSLAYLKKLPVSELKIDRSFIKNMETDRDDNMIVHSTIDLAHNMGLKVVAEGVENAATWSGLEELGCDFLQGYAISPPVPLPTFLNWVKESPWQLNQVA